MAVTGDRCRDPLDEFDMLVEQGATPPRLDVLADERLDERRLAGASLADDVHMRKTVGLLDAENKSGGDYVVFDPTGQQAYPAFTNAQRLGIGAPVIEIVRVIIQVNKELGKPKRIPDRKKPEPTNPKAPTGPKGV